MAYRLSINVDDLLFLKNLDKLFVLRKLSDLDLLLLGLQLKLPLGGDDRLLLHLQLLLLLLLFFHLSSSPLPLR